MTNVIKTKYSSYLLFILLMSLHSSALAEFKKNTASYSAVDIIMLIFKSISIVGGTIGVFCIARALFIIGDTLKECYSLIATTILVGSAYEIVKLLFFIGKIIASSIIK